MLVNIAVFGLCALATVSSAAEADDKAKQESPTEHPRVKKPFNLGINIPHIFNMKLLTGSEGTGLGIDIPAIFKLRLGSQHGTAAGLQGSKPGAGLLINLFGSDIVNSRRPPGYLRPEADYDTDLREAKKN
ncbi:uncharacterized protein LOC135398127 [Ornithodoros turicata]|uniref:uncharacterized protein LOC135398127 n=1 Tax=Ornithodoros turicata TaxID=34597 RepID=UPI0031396CBC